MCPKEEEDLKDQIWVFVFGDIFKSPHYTDHVVKQSLILLLTVLYHFTHASLTLSLLSCTMLIVRCEQKYLNLRMDNASTQNLCVYLYLQQPDVTVISGAKLALLGIWD